jgi:hypothetical protein
VASILIVILGGLAILRTPTDIFPNIDIPVVSIIWSYNGPVPEDMHHPECCGKLTNNLKCWSDAYDLDWGRPSRDGSLGDPSSVTRIGSTTFAIQANDRSWKGGNHENVR